MSERGAGEARRALVAGLARRRSRDVVVGLPDRLRAIVARGATGRDACMVEPRGSERDGVCMTRLAGGSRCDVRCGLALRVRAIVARSARTPSFPVILPRLVPTCDRVARCAGVGRRRMCSGLADGRRTIVTRGADAWGT